MHAVTTLSNNKIKEITKLHLKKYRDKEKLFIAEGTKIFEEVIDNGIETVEIFALDTFKPTKKTDKITVISEKEMKKISTTASACEVLVIAKQKKFQKKLNGNKIILLDRISDPGNLGTIIRSAAAFGTDGIILFGDCVELYSPKVIRSCAGNFFKTNVTEIKDIEELKASFKEYTFISTVLKKENNISPKDIKNTEKIVLMFGSEADGLSPELVKLAYKNIVLRMKKEVESLNLSVSASVLMYELF